MPEQYVGSNRTIAKNTLVLYVRMFLVLVVGLYTTRVVLSTLGVEDFGVYNAVGGVVGMLSFLNSAMSGATSRFIAYELGRGDEVRLRQTFKSAFLVHVGIALFIFIAMETGGLWFLNHRIVIPPGRETSARVIFHASVCTSMLGIMNVPFSACIVAHEKMEIYAYVEIYRVLAKLGIVFLLPVLLYDKLIAYALLMMFVTASVMMINNSYCRHHFTESRLKGSSDKAIVREMVSFSLYNLFGNFGSVFNRQGIIILINNFFGVVANAAGSLATTVANMVSTFANTMITAFRPPITKSYSSGNIKAVEQYSLMALVLAIYLFALVAIPAGIEMEKLIDLWQEIVPENTVLFSRIILLCILFAIIRYIVTITIHATGKVRTMSLFNGIILSLNPFLIYIAFKSSAPVYWAYLLYMCSNMTLAVISIILMTRYVPEVSRKRVFWYILRGLLIGAFVCAVSYLIVRRIPSSIGRIFLTTAVSSVILSTLYYFICLNGDQRGMVKEYIVRKLRK